MIAAATAELLETELGECRLAVAYVDGSVDHRGRKLVVVGLKSADFGFEILYSLLQSAHFLNHTGVRSSDVAE